MSRGTRTMALVVAHDAVRAYARGTGTPVGEATMTPSAR